MKNCPVEMKKSFTNPAKSEVLASDNDTTLSLYVRELASIKSLSPLEEKAVAKRAQEGDKEAKKQLVQANLKLVITIAKKQFTCLAYL